MEINATTLDIYGNTWTYEESIGKLWKHRKFRLVLKHGVPVLSVQPRCEGSGDLMFRDGWKTRRVER